MPAPLRPGKSARPERCPSIRAPCAAVHVRRLKTASVFDLESGLTSDGTPLTAGRTRCPDLLAITGKPAALYAEAVPDGGVAQAVTGIEPSGASLSRKIWQKIALIAAQPRGKARKLPD